MKTPRVIKNLVPAPVKKRASGVRPRKLSQAEELFALHARAAKLPPFWREYEFLRDRKFRFDFAWPMDLVALEVEGIVRPGSKSRHTTIGGYTNDCEKYSLAAIAGWRIIRATQKQVKDGSAVAWVAAALRFKDKPPPREVGMVTIEGIGPTLMHPMDIDYLTKHMTNIRKGKTK